MKTGICCFDIESFCGLGEFSQITLPQKDTNTTGAKRNKLTYSKRLSEADEIMKKISMKK